MFASSGHRLGLSNDFIPFDISDEEQRPEIKNQVRRLEPSMTHTVEGTHLGDAYSNLVDYGPNDQIAVCN